MIERIICHWTAGRHTSTEHERCSYHWLIEHHNRGDPNRLDDDNLKIISGVPWQKNNRRVYTNDGRPRLPCYCEDPEGYACHARGANSHSVGIALCGMWEAKDFRPNGGVDPGPYPITRLQVRGLINVIFSLTHRFRISVDPDTIMTHAEADRKQGVTGRRWDIEWIPGKNLGLYETGDWIRNQVRRKINGQNVEI